MEMFIEIFYAFYRWGEVDDSCDSYRGDDIDDCLWDYGWDDKTNSAKNFIYKNFENRLCGRDSRPITQNPLFYFGNQVTPWAIGQSLFDHSLNVHFNSIV